MLAQNETILGFEGPFSVNFQIPELLGLGKSVSQGFGTVWLGADRYVGFGKCSVALEMVDQPSWLNEYSYLKQEQIGSDLYLLAVSPLTMLNDRGDPCGLDEKALAEKLGVASVEILHCSTSITQTGGHNRIWRCRAPSLRIYDRGSLFHLVCSQPPVLERVRQVQEEGLGIRRAEGFGRVLFLPETLLKGLDTKESVRPEDSTFEAGQTAQIRRAKYSWVMDTIKKL